MKEMFYALVFAMGISAIIFSWLFATQQQCDPIHEWEMKYFTPPMWCVTGRAHVAGAPKVEGP